MPSMGPASETMGGVPGVGAALLGIRWHGPPLWRGTHSFVALALGGWWFRADLLCCDPDDCLFELFTCLFSHELRSVPGETGAKQEAASVRGQRRDREERAQAVYPSRAHQNRALGSCERDQSRVGRA